MCEAGVKLGVGRCEQLNEVKWPLRRAWGEEYKLTLQAVLRTSDIVLRQWETSDEGKAGWQPGFHFNKSLAAVGSGLSGDKNRCEEGRNHLERRQLLELLGKGTFVWTGEGDGSGHGERRDLRKRGVSSTWRLG